MPSLLVNISYLLILLSVGYDCSKDAVPVHLEVCYGKNVVILPRSLSTLHDIILKIEKSNLLLGSVDVATAILHRFSYDGIERDPRVASSTINEENIIPFRTTGCQRVRSQLLRDYLLPGFAPHLAPGLLTVSEQCTLHFMLSSSVDPWERGDEYKICPGLVSAHNTVDVETGALRSPCPTEGGIMFAGNQAVAPARFLAGIVAVLNPSDYVFDGRVIQTQWAASIAGDLAEVAVFQAGFVEHPWVGASGVWNDTVLPTKFYMLEKDSNFTKYGLWQFTDAELLGDIDGLIMGVILKQAGIAQLRLSQLLDLYYSGNGINMGFSTSADREYFLPDILSKKKEILFQAKLFANMIKWSTPTITIDSNKLDSYLEEAFSAFESRTRIIKLGASFEKRKPATKTSLNVIYDSSFPSYDTLKVLYELAEGIDVWEWGSRISVINGETGAIIVKDAITRGDLMLNWLNASETNRQAEKLSLSKSLLSLIKLIRIRAMEVCENDDEPPVYSHVTLILDMSNSLTDKEFSLASSVIHDLFIQHPEMNYTFVSHNKLEIEELFEAQYIDRVNVIDPNDFLEKSLKLISQVERVLMPGACCSGGSDSDTELVEVIYPSIPYYYRIPSQYFCNSSVPSLNVMNDVYGTLKICAGSARYSDDLGCLIVAPSASVEVPLHHPNCPFPPCPGLHFFISLNSTSSNCHEMLCETTDGVQYTLQLTGMKCLSNLTTHCSSATIISSNLLYVTIFFYLYKIFFS